MKKSKIVMFGILLLALSISTSTVLAADEYDWFSPWSWGGVEWTESIISAYTIDYDVPDGDTDVLIMYNYGVEGGKMASKLTYFTNETQTEPWNQFIFKTPYLEGTPDTVDPSAEAEFKFSSGDGDEFLIHLDHYTLSYLAKKTNGVEYTGNISTPSGIWASSAGTNTLRIGIRPEAEGGDVDIWFNNHRLFTFADADFAYDGYSILQGSAHILCRSTDPGTAIEFTGYTGGGGYSYTVRNPSIDSLNTTSVTEKQSFELSGSFSDLDSWETWSAEVTWESGVIETFNNISLGSFSFTHAYPNDGSYSGSITITDNEGGTTGAVSFTAVISDVGPVISNFDYGTTVVESNNTVAITVDINASPDSIDTTTWTEGAVILSTDEDPTIIFNDLNSHDVTLTVVDSDGSSSSDTWTVSPTTPDIILDAHSPADIGDPVTFTGTFTHDGYSISSVEFDYGDGTIESGSYTGVDVSGTHSYSNPNTYAVEVTVTSSSGQTATDSISVTINAKPPVVTFKEATISIDEGESQTFDLTLVDTTSYTGSLTYSWTVTAPDTSETVHNGASFTSIFTQNGTYTVEMQVMENGLSDTDTIDLIVSNIAPQVTLGANIYEIPIGTLVDFTSTVYDDGEDIQSITFLIEGDLTEYPPDNIDIETDPSYHEKGYFDYTFNELGSFLVSSTATDDTTSVTSSITVTVIGVPLELQAIVASPSHIDELDSVYFTSRITGTNLNQTYTVEWYFDGALVDTLYDISVEETIPYARTFPQDTPFELELKISGTSLTQTYHGYVDNTAPVVTIDHIDKLRLPGTRTLNGHIADAADHPFAYEWYVKGVRVDHGNLNDGYDLSLTYEFSSSGSYSIELRVTDNDNDDVYQGTGFETVRVNYKPDIDSVDFSPKPAQQWSPVQFEVEAHDPDGSSLSYYWEFGDGETSSEQNPIHIYSEYGEMVATVRVTDAMGTSRSQSIPVDVQPLVVSIEPINQDIDPIYEGDTVIFTTSFMVEDHAQDYTVEWILNGTVVSTINNVAIGDPIELAYLFPQDGSYTLQLVVVEASTTETLSIEVDNRAPIVTLDPVTPLLYLETVDFTATVDDVNADHPFGYVLTLDSGEEYAGVLSEGFTITIPHTFTIGGTFEVEIKVYDPSGDEGEDLITVEVNNPPVILSVSFEPEIVTQGETVQFTIVASDPDEGELSYHWEFGDGGSSDQQNPTYEYANYGLMTVLVSVTDEAGAVVTRSFVLDVDPDMAPPRDLKNHAIKLLENELGDYDDYGKAKGLPKKDKDYVKSSKNIDKSINKIIKFIEKSLNEDYWVDDFTLEPKHGIKVFNYERVAVSTAEHYAKKWRNDSELNGLVNTFYEVIDLLVEADRSLAKLALEEAQQVEIPPGSPIEQYLINAEKHYLKGKEYIAEERWTSAINSFKVSWLHSQQVLEYFSPNLDDDDFDD